MNATEAKCSCQHCSEHIAFEAVYAGQLTTCPHCGSETRLFIPSRAPSRAVRAGGTEDKDSSSLVGFGYIFSLLIPVVGLILGIVLLTKGKAGHGVACIVISLFVAGAIWSLMNS